MILPGYNLFIDKVDRNKENRTVINRINGKMKNDLNAGFFIARPKTNLMLYHKIIHKFSCNKAVDILRTV